VSDDFIAGLRGDLVEAAARERARGRAGRAARPFLPRAWSPRIVLRAAAAAVAAAAFVVAVLALAHPRPAEPARPRIVGTIPTGVAPFCESYADGRLWIADSAGGLVTIDLARRRVTGRVRVGASPTGIVGGRDGVWERMDSGGASRVVRIDPATGRTSAQVGVGRGAGLAVDERFVWAPTNASSAPAGIDRIDRARGVVTRRLPVAGAVDVVSAGGILWAPTRGGALLEIDATTGRVLERFPDVAPAGASAMVAADRGMWLLDTQGSEIVRFAGRRIVDRIPVDPDTQPLLARTRSGLWTVTGGPGSVTAEPTRLVRIDPDTHRVTGTVGLGGQSVQALLGAGRDLLAVTDRGRVIVVRG